MEHHLVTSLRVLDRLVSESRARGYTDFKYIAFGGTAYAYHFKDPNTKDFDVLIVAKGMKQRWKAFWEGLARPFFKALGYSVEEQTAFNRRTAIETFGQNHVRRYGIVTYKTVFGPSMIDVNFADSDLFEGEGLRETSRWYTKIDEYVHVISKNRLILDIVYDLHRGDQKRMRAQRALENMRRKSTAVEPDVRRRIAMAFESQPLDIVGWGTGTLGWGSGVKRSAKLHQIILSGIALSTPWLENMGIYAVLKGGTVSTQYTASLQTNNIDVQMYKKNNSAARSFYPSTRVPGNVNSNEKNWGMYFGKGALGSIVGFVVFMTEILRTIEKSSLIKTLETAGIRARDVMFGMRISHPPRNTKHITLLSIDMLIVTSSSGSETYPVFDCVLGDIRNIPRSVHFSGNKIKMQSSEALNVNFMKILESANPIKEEKRLKRFLEKKLGGNTIRTSVENLVLNSRPVNVPLVSVPAAAWERIRDAYVFGSDNQTKVAIKKMLEASEKSAGNIDNVIAIQKNILTWAL